MKHSRLGASKAHRWLNCPGSPRVEAGIKDKPSRFAAEGTAAHEVAEYCLVHGIDATAYPEKRVAVDNRNGAKWYFPVNDDLTGAVQVYLDTIRGDQGPYDSLAVEEKFALSWLHKDLFGTNDASLGVPFGPLRVYDYKHGAGKWVDAVGNEQMMYYALGRLGPENDECFETAEMVIVQPRHHDAKGPVRRWSIPVDELYAWGENVLAPGAEAASQPDAPLCAGDWCSFCKYEGRCEAKRGKVSAVIRPELDLTAPNLTLPAAEDLTPEQRGRVLEAAGLIKSWAASVHEYEIECQLAGKGAPGWKMVTKLGNRAWADAEEAEKTLQAYDDLYEDPKFKSPAQIEKTLVAQGFAKKTAKEKVDSLCARPESQTLVPEEDPRPAIGPIFTPIEE
jgi:hypothetical protein